MAGRRSLDREVPVDQIERGLIPAHKQAPSAEEAVAVSDELEWIFAHLDATGRRILELRGQGAELAEIARATNRSERTVRRRLQGPAISSPSARTMQNHCSPIKTFCCSE